MKKSIQLWVVFALASILSFANVVTSFASTPNSEDCQYEYVTEGYTEEGVHYILYEEVISNTDKDYEITPRIVVSKKVRVSLNFDGNIVPPSTYRYSVYDNDYDTEMTGTLSLLTYVYDGWPLDETRALYDGTVFGNI